jgi:teichuronic acid exporter
MSLKQKVVSGLKWSALSKLAAQVFSWVSTFWVIRILTPEDYGLVAVAMVFFSFIGMFTNNGLVTALLQDQSKSKAKCDQIFTLSIGINLALSGLLVLLAPTIAASYESDQLVYVLWVLAALNPLHSLTVVPMAIMQIDMDFKKKAIIESTAGLISTVVAFVSAHLGYGFWALVWANVAMTCARALGYNLMTSQRYGLTRDFANSRDILSFAMHTQLGSFLWFAYTKADTVIISKLLGLTQAGVYNVAGQVASIPMDKLGSIVNEVSISAFAKSKTDSRALEAHLKNGLSLLGMVMFPVFFGLSAIAPELVSLVLGDKWLAAGGIIVLLAFVLPFRMVSILMANFATAQGLAKFVLHNSVVVSTVLITSIAIGASYGLLQTAIGWQIGFAIVYLFLLVRYIRRFNLRISTLLAYWPSLFVSAGMWIAIWLADRYVLLDLALVDWQSMLIKMLLGALWVLPFYWVLHRHNVMALLKR